MEYEMNLFEEQTPVDSNKHIYSVFHKENECLKAILKVHCNNADIELDPMYNKGNFYNKGDIRKPKYRFDLNAEKMGYDAENGDATNLPIENNSISTMILDPPVYVWNTRENIRKPYNEKIYDV